MQSRLLAILLGILAAVPVTSVASAQALDTAGIRGFVSGKRVLLKTPYGLELPLTYRTDGSVAGDVSGFRLASMFAPKETGKWWVESNRLCQKWPTWYDGKQFCFTIEKTGPASLSWVRDDGMMGTARIDG